MGAPSAAPPGRSAPSARSGACARMRERHATGPLKEVSDLRENTDDMVVSSDHYLLGRSNADLGPATRGVTLRTSYMPTRKRGRALGVAVAVAVFAFPALAEAERPVKPSKPTVMTRN